MGNAISLKVDVPKDYSASAGHNSLWKIWHGKSKDTGRNVSVWVFDRQELSTRKVAPITDKTMLEQIHQIMRKDLIALKEASCTNVVEVLEILDDSKTAIAFTTERVVCSLSDILSRFHGIAEGRRSCENFLETNGTLSEIDIGRGLLNIGEGLQYFHTVCKKLHASISPESVVITSTGQWKICSFGLSLSFLGSDNQLAASPYFLRIMPNSHLMRLEPDLAYSSPELSAGGSSSPSVRYISPATDIYSLGILAYEVYRFCLKTAAEGRAFTPTVCVSNNSADYHAVALEAMRSLDFSFLPLEIVPLIASMLQADARQRPSIAEVIGHQFFASGAMAVLKSIASLHTRDVGTQSSHLAALSGQLAGFSTRILERSVLPVICGLCGSNPVLWVYALPLHEHINSRMAPGTYAVAAGQHIANGLLGSAVVESMLAFLKAHVFIQETFDAAFFTRYFIQGLVCNALDKQHSQLQSVAFQVLSEERARNSIDMNTLAEKIVPRTCKNACKNPDPRIKIHALFFLSLVCSRLNRAYLAANILPSLKYITDNDKNPIVSMCVIGNYEAISECVGPEYIASSILPTIQPMLIDRSLNRQQFEQVVSLMRSMLAKVLEMRSTEMGIAPAITMVGPGSSGLAGDRSFDPFAAARAMVGAQGQGHGQGQGQATKDSAPAPTPVPAFGAAPMSAPSPVGGLPPVAFGSPFAASSANSAPIPQTAAAAAPPPPVGAFGAPFPQPASAAAPFSSAPSSSSSSLPSTAPAASAASAQLDDDFFSSFDKVAVATPKVVKKPPLVKVGGGSGTHSAGSTSPGGSGSGSGSASSSSSSRKNARGSGGANAGQQVDAGSYQASSGGTGGTGGQISASSPSPAHSAPMSQQQQQQQYQQQQYQQQQQLQLQQQQYQQQYLQQQQQQYQQPVPQQSYGFQQQPQWTGAGIGGGANPSMGMGMGMGSGAGQATGMGTGMGMGMGMGMGTQGSFPTGGGGHMGASPAGGHAPMMPRSSGNSTGASSDPFDFLN